MEEPHLVLAAAQFRARQARRHGGAQRHLRPWQHRGRHGEDDGLPRDGAGQPHQVSGLQALWYGEVRVVQDPQGGSLDQGALRRRADAGDARHARRTGALGDLLADGLPPDHVVHPLALVLDLGNLDHPQLHRHLLPAPVAGLHAAEGPVHHELYQAAQCLVGRDVVLGQQSGAAPPLLHHASDVPPCRQALHLAIPRHRRLELGHAGRVQAPRCEQRALQLLRVAAVRGAAEVPAGHPPRCPVDWARQLLPRQAAGKGRV
mmetsp:Transcript_54840/g.148002  ORF Transcript_54840/g.148002 Transcript_54840/m.148002 type:complete len:261 (-) Transcript_54840:40-822(-)